MTADYQVVWTDPDGEGYRISTNTHELDIATIHSFLETSYWAVGRSLKTTEKAVKNSLCFGVYRQKDNIQVGFARVVTDRVTFSWLGDLFILEAFRGKGLGVWLVQSILHHPDLCNLPSILATKDAHTLYEKFGYNQKQCMRRPPSSQL